MSSQSTLTILLSAAMAAPPRQVVEVLSACRPDDVELLDAATATALRVVAELAIVGTPPTADVVNAELLRRGAYHGHHGDLVRTRMIDAAGNPQQLPELLPEYASAVLSDLFRARLRAAGEALVTGAADACEDDLWALLLREGAAVRSLRDRLAVVRGDPR
ncbi:hypothetical protein AAFP35_24270 [Gordonia sp. CPCC 206044]|uniref:hypothetical protein n=1 Tax=Gordonia sp. CPCC 206044 TaxID=3140793 RepID=UPI003AF3A00F